MRRIPACAAALIVALTACTASSKTPEPNEEGMVSFGCALAANSQGWEDDLTPDSDEPTIPAPYGVAALFGAQTATPMAGFENFEEGARDLARAASALDVETTNDVLADLVELCDEEGISYDNLNTDEDAVAEFSCSLANTAVNNDAPIDEWLRPAQEDNMELNAATSAGTLLSTIELRDSEAYSHFYDDAIGVVEAVSRLSSEMMETHLAAIDSTCQE